MAFAIRPLWFLIAVGLAARAHGAEPPVVQCRSVAQGEERKPQKPGSLPDLAATDAARLAYYVSADHAVLAPRDWHCFENGGSSGSFLIVAPDEAAVLKPPQGGITGPAVQMSLSYAGTSGRFFVARVIAQLFPEKRRFVQSVIDEGLAPAGSFPNGPPPTDQLARIGPGIVEFVTPPDHDGVGTQSWLAKGPLAIHGVAMLREEDEGNVETVMIRLPQQQDTLARAVISEVEYRLSR